MSTVATLTTSLRENWSHCMTAEAIAYGVDFLRGDSNSQEGIAPLGLYTAPAQCSVRPPLKGAFANSATRS